MRLVSRVRYAFIAALLLVSSLASARVISYSPYTNRSAYPLTQSRTNRYFVLYELATASTGQLVLYDSTGVEEPRVVFPAEGQPPAYIYGGAVREKNGVSSILVEAALPNAPHLSWYFSSDGGHNWTTVNVPQVSLYLPGDFTADIGGPIARSRYSALRIGSDAMPFVIAAQQQGSIVGVNADGSVRTLFAGPVTPNLALLGTNRDGTKFLFRDATGYASILDMNSNVTPIALFRTDSALDGWITSTNAVYLEVITRTPFDHYVVRYDGTTPNILVENSGGDTSGLGVFAIPTADYEGAWIVKRGTGIPTALYQQSGPNNAVMQWSDATSPEVEALHAGNTGNTLLIQVHRPRVVDTIRFLDPALAVWHTGDPAPRNFDELFMNETVKRFVHLDVDKIAGGEPFVFDSGVQSQQPVGIPVSFPLPSAGGSDVLQEWGVVRASLKQKLVLPGMARTQGMFNSYWQSDVVLYNPAADPQNVRIDYVQTGDSFTTSDVKTTTLTLAGKEIRVIPDALKTLFNLDTGGGAFFLTPDLGVNATSRTYTTANNGTYGFSMNAIDFFGGAASPRFPVTFSGAFPGTNFRTNVVITDTSGRGTEATFSGAGILGAIGTATPLFSTPPNGQVQLNSITPALGILDSEPGALIVQPTRGTAIASVIAIDNRTNDPTYFPPDLPSSTVRTIPAIGHLDGANGSKFRSDLYLYNPSDQSHTVTLQVKAWDTAESPVQVQFTLLPGEARIIPDVLMKLFGKTGIARLRFQTTDVSPGGQGIRLTSRTYSVDANGGTYGFLMPALNNFQMGTSGDTLEILGVVGGKGFRTNLGFVETTPWPNGTNVQARVEIIDDKGRTIDTFTMNVPLAGGVQINDLFHARGLGDGPAAALIRVSPITGTIGAYATMNDNGTNDPTYLAANLAAQ